MRTPLRLVAPLALASSWLAPAPAAADVVAASFHSAALGREVGYVVSVPASYATGTRRYPVVYALHGLFEGSSFLERRGLLPLIDEAVRRGELPEVIVVAADGDNSFFVNGPAGRYQDLVTHDLVAQVESHWRVVPGRGGRVLLGVSMGGYAALRIAFSEPGVFAAVASHSAMLLRAIPTSEAGAGRWHMAAFHAAFGDPIDAGLWSAADPLALAQTAATRDLPALYFDCGSEDRFGLYAGNQELHRRLAARDVPHEFALYPGDHGYEYVRSVLPRSLRFLGRALAATPASMGTNVQR